MSSYLPFPDIGPDIFALEVFGFTLALRWYAMAYIVGIIAGWRIAVAACRRSQLWGPGGPALSAPQIEDFLTWIVIGIVGGGRLGYVIFYQPLYYLSAPWEIPMIWQGGMSFHGGLAGVTLAILIYWRRHNLQLWALADLLAICVAPGLLLGRIANFINGELWGRPTLSPNGVAFPGFNAQDCPAALTHTDGICARFPSQLYEAALEGLILGTLLLILAFGFGWLKRTGWLTGLFLIGYGISRFIVEFFRQADAQFITPDNPLGWVVQFGGAGVSMGQLLSLPMVAFGIAVLIWVRPRPAPVQSQAE